MTHTTGWIEFPACAAACTPNDPGTVAPARCEPRDTIDTIVTVAIARNNLRMRSSSELQLHNQLLGVIGPSSEFARCALQMYRIARGARLLCQGELLFESSLPVHSSFRVASDTRALTTAGAGRVDCTRTDRDRPELHYADISALKAERISESMISSHGRYSAAEISAKLTR